MGAWEGGGGTGGHRVMTQNMLLSDSNPPNSATRSSVLLAHIQTSTDLGRGGGWGEHAQANPEGMLLSVYEPLMSSRCLLKKRHGRTGGDWVATQGVLFPEVFCHNVVQGHVELSSPSFG